MYKLTIFKKNKNENIVTTNDVLIELDDNEIDNVVAVGNSFESSKWILNNSMSDLINRKIY